MTVTSQHVTVSNRQEPVAIPCPGASGRLHRNETGDWVWSSDEEGDSDDETIQKKKSSKQVP